MSINHLFYQGDSLEVLRKLPDESVHCCVTSPPYWGLRAFGTNPQVWGGDPECNHEWNLFARPGISGGVNDWSKELYQGQDGASNVPESQQAFCQKCGAWRGELGLEPTPELFVSHLVDVFREVRRVLRDDATCWVNLGDSYNSSTQFNNHTGLDEADRYNEIVGKKWAGHRPLIKSLKPKDLVGIPWMVAFALRADGWWLRSDIIWAKSNPMPESVTDRPTKSHEYLFLLAKAERYHYDAEAIREPWDPKSVQRDQRGYHGAFLGRTRMADPRDARDTGLDGRKGNYAGRNRRTVWTIATQPFKEAHFATFPQALVEPCILAGTSEKACPKCGAPWERVVEKGKPILNAWSASGAGQYDDSIRGMRRTSLAEGSTLKHVVPRTTIGFRPTCSCPDNDGSGACVVLDPFGGSGTVSLVAKRLGRGSIYIDLNPEYLQMALKRMGNQETLFEKHRIEVIQ